MFIIKSRALVMQKAVYSPLIRKNMRSVVLYANLKWTYEVRFWFFTRTNGTLPWQNPQKFIDDGHPYQKGTNHTMHQAYKARFGRSRSRSPSSHSHESCV